MSNEELEVELAARRLKDWLRWLRDNHPEDIPTQGALAKKLGISEGGMSQWLASGSTRAFQFRYVLAIRRLLQDYFPLDYLLDHDPPSAPQHLMAAEPPTHYGPKKTPKRK